MQNIEKKPAGERRDQDLYGGLIRLHILHHVYHLPSVELAFSTLLDRSGAVKIPGENTFFEKVSAKMFRQDPIAHPHENTAAPLGKRDTCRVWRALAAGSSRFCAPA